MKYLFIILFTFSILLATADGPSCWAVANVDSTDVLNVRREPNHLSEIAGTIPYDAEGLINLETTGGLTFDEFTSLSKEEKDSIRIVRPRWQKVMYDSLVGWVNGKFVVEGNCDSTND